MNRATGPIVVAAYGIGCCVLGVLVGYVISDEHPSYHCDGSTIMGYAVPGTPEAAACWIEGGEK